MELLALLGLVVLIPLNVLLDGWVLTKLWMWFVVPTFGLPELGIAPAIGLSIIISYLTYHQSTTSSEDKYESKGVKIARAVGASILTPLFYLFIGWVISWFM